MKLSKMITVVAFFIGFAPSVWASTAPVFASCYSASGANLLMGFDADAKMFSLTYSNGENVRAFESQPNSDWAAQFARIEVSGVGTSAVLLKAHIINGNQETPIFDADASVTVQQHADGSYYLASAEIYHDSQWVDISEFIGAGCYVQ